MELNGYFFLRKLERQASCEKISEMKANVSQLEAMA